MGLNCKRQKQLDITRTDLHVLYEEIYYTLGLQKEFFLLLYDTTNYVLFFIDSSAFLGDNALLTATMSVHEGGVHSHGSLDRSSFDMINTMN